MEGEFISSPQKGTTASVTQTQARNRNPAGEKTVAALTSRVASSHYFTGGGGRK